MKNIKCDFCSKVISCPEDELNMDKHACYECFLKQEELLPDEELDQIQVDIPDEELNNIAVRNIVEETFPEIWEGRKEEWEELSKEELARMMFAEGASAMAERMLEMEDEEEGYEEDQEE